MGTRTQCEQTGSSSPLPVYTASATQACRVSFEKSPMKICYPMFYCWITSWKREGRERERMNFLLLYKLTGKGGRKGGRKGEREGGGRTGLNRTSQLRCWWACCLLLCCHFLLNWWGSLFWKFHIKHSTTQVHISSKCCKPGLMNWKQLLPTASDTKKQLLSFPTHPPKHHFKTRQWANI